MLGELISIHHEVMSTTALTFKRYLLEEIHWENQAICLLGDRGVGKTTLMVQRLLLAYQDVERALYISADNINVLGKGLFHIARTYFSEGGEALFIDEVHKYPNWSIEIKNIIDTYKRKKIIFSGSSSIDLTKSKGDLSRRVVYYRLPGLSFREYLQLVTGKPQAAYSLQDILNQHGKIAATLKTIPVLKYFKEYLAYGYYPIFLEGTEDYLAKINNVIEKVIYEDVSVVFNLKQTTVTVLKKILWLIATAESMTPNIDRISKDIAVSREVIYSCFEYLERSGLINNIFPHTKGLKLIRKPGKVFLNNTNLLHAITGALKFDVSAGNIRETMFVNQVSIKHHLHLHEKADFIIDGEIVVEVGGATKSNRQLKNEEKGYLAIDGIEVGYQHKIPLYMFGLLY